MYMLSRVSRCFSLWQQSGGGLVFYWCAFSTIRHSISQPAQWHTRSQMFVARLIHSVALRRFGIETKQQIWNVKVHWHELLWWAYVLPEFSIARFPNSDNETLNSPPPWKKNGLVKICRIINIDWVRLNVPPTQYRSYGERIINNSADKVTRFSIYFRP